MSFCSHTLNCKSYFPNKSRVRRSKNPCTWNEREYYRIIWSTRSSGIHEFFWLLTGCWFYRHHRHYCPSPPPNAVMLFIKFDRMINERQKYLKTEQNTEKKENYKPYASQVNRAASVHKRLLVNCLKFDCKHFASQSVCQKKKNEHTPFIWRRCKPSHFRIHSRPIKRNPLKASLFQIHLYSQKWLACNLSPTFFFKCRTKNEIKIKLTLTNSSLFPFFSICRYGYITKC